MPTLDDITEVKKEKKKKNWINKLFENPTNDMCDEFIERELKEIYGIK